MRIEVSTQDIEDNNIDAEIEIEVIPQQRLSLWSEPIPAQIDVVSVYYIFRNDQEIDHSEFYNFNWDSIIKEKLTEEKEYAILVANA